MGPKTPPPYKNKIVVPEMLNELLDVFLPSTISKQSKLNERKLITEFITDLIEVG